MGHFVGLPAEALHPIVQFFLKLRQRSAFRSVLFDRRTDRFADHQTGQAGSQLMRRLLPNLRQRAAKGAADEGRRSGGKLTAARLVPGCEGRKQGQPAGDGPAGPIAAQHSSAREANSHSVVHERPLAGTARKEHQFRLVGAVEQRFKPADQVALAGAPRTTGHIPNKWPGSGKPTAPADKLVPVERRDRPVLAGRAAPPSGPVVGHRGREPLFQDFAPVQPDELERAAGFPPLERAFRPLGQQAEEQVVEQPAA